MSPLRHKHFSTKTKHHKGQSSNVLCHSPIEISVHASSHVARCGGFRNVVVVVVVVSRDADVDVSET